MPPSPRAWYNDHMTKTLLVQFDGHVLVPQEPVDLPVGCTLEVQVQSSGRSGETSWSDVADWIDALPPVDRGDLPQDGAAQYEHYLYGHPKQS